MQCLIRKIWRTSQMTFPLAFLLVLIYSDHLDGDPNVLNYDKLNQAFTFEEIKGISLKFTIASIEKDLQGLNLGGLGELPGNLTSKIPSQEDAEKIFADKCRKNGGEEAYVKAQSAKEEIAQCITKLVDVEQLQKEMEEAKPSGDLDVVFKKYCKKSPDLVACVEKFTTDIEPCLEEEERKSKNIVLNATSQLVEFSCFKEGDRIALFFAEGGPECFNASEKGLKDCAQSILHLPDDGEEFGLNSIPALLFESEQCEVFSKLQKCVVSELEKCSEPTPANIVDSLFNYIRKVTPCSKFKFEEALPSTRDSGADILTSSKIFAFTLINFIFLRYFF